MYQQKQHELLPGLKGIEPIADYIFLVGCGDMDQQVKNDQDFKLQALLEYCREVKPQMIFK